MGDARIAPAVQRWYDYSLVFIILLLLAFGLVMIFSSSYAATKYGGTHYLFRQLLWTGLGIVVMILVSLVDYHRWLRLAGLGYVVSIALMLLIYLTPLGKTANGKTRWLMINDVSLFQPSEVVKIAIIVFMAAACGRLIRQMDKGVVLALLLVMAAVPAALVVFSNLSTGIIIAGIAYTVCFVASRRKLRFLVILLVLIGIAALIVWMIQRGMFDSFDSYIIKRVKVWLDIERYAADGGYQTMQGYYAIGSGGWTGKGLGNSLQKLGKIPEAHNDMIFAIICEELGVVGAACLMLLYMYLIYRLLVIAMNAPDIQGMLMVAGVIVHVSLQTVLHIAVVLGMIPNTGVSLPFVSYGGSSTMMLMAEMGLALGVSRTVVFKQVETPREGRRLIPFRPKAVF